MKIPRVGDVYVDPNQHKFIIIGSETKDDGFYTHYRDEMHKVFSCKVEAFFERFSILNNN
jgi:hypothetical protein